MFEYLTQMIIETGRVFKALPTSRKVVILMVITVTLAGFISISIWANTPKYVTLYSGLSQTEAGEIVNKLKEKKVPFKLEGDGTTITVTEEDLRETRLSLATEGLPRGGSVGMEIFNKNSLSTTSFVQRLNYQRAIQGELERTIIRFPEVQHVRVHLNIPKESLFMEEARDPSASVVLNLYANKSLNQAQIMGVVHLVASSVQGLKAENISLVDTAGGLIYKKEEDAGGLLLTNSQLQQRKMLEKGLAEKITSMLERVIGPNKAVARVTAELDFSRVSTTEEIFNPDLVVIRSEQRTSEKTRGPARGASGAPSARYNLDGTKAQGTGQDDGRELYEKTDETVNYDIAKINKQTIIPAGGIKRLSVAVIVDNRYEEKEEDGKMVKIAVTRTEEELEGLTKIVRHAIGYDEKRGDTVVVSSLSFFVPEEEKPSVAESWWMDYLRQAAKPLVNVLLIVLFFLFVVRPLMGWIKREAKVVGQIPAEGEEEFALPGVERVAALPEDIAEAEIPLPDKVREMTNQNPDRALDLIQAWIAE